MNWPVLDFTLTNAVVTGFASFALSMFVSGKDGPFKIFLKLRTFVGTPLECFVCSAGFWMVSLVCIIDVLTFGLHSSNPLMIYVTLAWGFVKMALSASGVALALLSLAGRLNLDN